MIVTQESTFNEAAIELFDTQLKNWELAEKNYRSFGANRQKTIQLGNSRVILQHNPARIVSAASKIKPDEAPKRPCFLCPQQLPPQQQKVQLNDLFCLLVNPYPIFYPHFTIAATQHISQQIFPYLPDMLYFSKKLNNFTVFFNGAGAGASAPDHLHFQACKKNSMPVETEWDMWMKSARKCSKQLYYASDSIRSLFLVEASDEQSALRAFQEITAFFPSKDTADVMMNILSIYDENKFRLLLFPRKTHRPSCYFSEGRKQLLVSPGAVDMGGLIILPRQDDFEKVTSDDLLCIFREICLFPLS